MLKQFTIFQKLLIVLGSVYFYSILFLLIDLIFSHGASSSNLIISVPVTIFACTIVLSVHFIFWKYSAKWSARLLYITGMILLGLVTAEPLYVMIFDGPITQRAVRERALEKGIQIAAVINKEITFDSSDLPSVITIIKETRGDKNQLQTELEELKKRKAEVVYDLSQTKTNWSRSERCITYFVKKKYTEAEAKTACRNMQVKKIKSVKY